MTIGGLILLAYLLVFVPLLLWAVLGLLRRYTGYGRLPLWARIPVSLGVLVLLVFGPFSEGIYKNVTLDWLCDAHAGYVVKKPVYVDGFEAIGLIPAGSVLRGKYKYVEAEFDSEEARYGLPSGKYRFVRYDEELGNCINPLEKKTECLSYMEIDEFKSDYLFHYRYEDHDFFTDKYGYDVTSEATAIFDKRSNEIIGLYRELKAEGSYVGGMVGSSPVNNIDCGKHETLLSILDKVLRPVAERGE